VKGGGVVCHSGGASRLEQVYLTRNRWDTGQLLEDIADIVAHLAARERPRKEACPPGSLLACPHAVSVKHTRVTIKTNIYFTIDEIGDTLLGHHMAQPRLRLDLSSEAARRVVKMFAISASCSTPLALQTLTQMLTRAAAL
jgi:hypothetical protein